MGSNLAKPVLVLPQLNQEEDPTQSDLRALQVWATQIPGPLFYAGDGGLFLGGIAVGTETPANIQKTWVRGSYVGTPASGILTINLAPISCFAYGYTPMVCPGDTANSLGQVVPILASCSVSKLVVECFSTTGTPITGVLVRVNFDLVGA